MITRRSFINKLLKFLFLPFASLGLSSFLASCFSYPVVIRKGYQSDHYDGKRFFHPHHKVERKSFSEVMKWRFNRVSGSWPETVKVNKSIPPSKVVSNDLKVSYIGHATVLLQSQGLNVLFDPHWGERASPVSFAGPKRITPPGVDLEDLPAIDYICLSHNHHDHLDPGTLKKIQALNIYRDKTIQLIVPLGNKSIIDEAIPGHQYQITELDWEDHFPLNDKMTLVAQPTYHWSARGLSDSNKALWCAFVIKSAHGNIYFAGDTGFGKGIHAGGQFKKTKEKFGSFRFSMLPVGAYEPRYFMRDQHINPEESVKGAELLNSKYILGIHLQTFKDLTDEGYDAPVMELEKALKNSSFDSNSFRVLQAGEVWDVPKV